MALDEDEKPIDLFGGRQDLENRLIRTVGDPNLRLREDGLRIFRALRFSTQLDFDLGEEERAAIAAHPEWGTPVSPERVRIEVEKGLCGAAPVRLEPMFAAGLMARFTDGAAGPDLSGLTALPSDPAARWAGLCTALTECGAVSGPEDFLRRLRVEKRTIKAILERMK
jgi:hypothetical protein